MDAHLLAMFKDYVDIVDAIRAGGYDGDIHSSDGQRLILHEQLLEATGLTRATNMYEYARNELYLAQLAGEAGH
jgi:hypothetical protein